VTRARTLAAVAAFALCSACGAATATRHAGPDTGPLVLGAVYPTGGAQGEGGAEEWHGVQLATELVNSQGGVGGRTVELRLLDVERGEDAPAAMRRLKEGGADLVLGSYGSTISAPASVAAAEAHQLFWETGAVGETVPGAAAGRTFFRLPPAGQTLGSEAVTFVHTEVAPRLHVTRPLRFSVVAVNDVYGAAVAGGATAEVARSGQVLAGLHRYDPRTFDPRALVREIKRDKPDVLFVTAYLDDGIAIRKATVAAHLPLLANIGTSSSYCMEDFGEELGTDAVGLFASDKPDAHQVNVAALTPDARAALAWAQPRYRARWGDDMTAAALTGFSSTWALLHHVLPAARSASVDDVAAAALRTHLPRGSLPNGSGLDLAPYGAADAGTNRAAASVVWEWVGVEQRAVVWPAAFANHPVALFGRHA
jgi:branched-chain amino acid transport system substrate-binding protein